MTRQRLSSVKCVCVGLSILTCACSLCVIMVCGSVSTLSLSQCKGAAAAWQADCNKQPVWPEVTLHPQTPGCIVSDEYYVAPMLGLLAHSKEPGLRCPAFFSSFTFPGTLVAMPRPPLVMCQGMQAATPACPTRRQLVTTCRSGVCNDSLLSPPTCAQLCTKALVRFFMSTQSSLQVC